MPATTIDEARTRLAACREALYELGVDALYIFGSVARGEADEFSDIDILVEFDRPVGMFTFLRLKRLLEEELEAPVDLVARDALKPELRDRILGDSIRAA